VTGVQTCVFRSNCGSKGKLQFPADELPPSEIINRNFI